MLAESVLLAVNYSGMLKTIRQWNRRQLLLHPRTCLEIRKLIRKEVPNQVDVITSASIESCHCSGGYDDTQVIQHVSILQMIYNAVTEAGFLGKTLFELQVCYYVASLHYLRLRVCVLLSFGFHI